jgi:DNA-binding NarL/FixJ family response regulator
MGVVTYSLPKALDPDTDQSRMLRRAPDDRAVVGRILVVEQHAVMATALQLALSERGWDVETTGGPTAKDVVDRARRFQPQCVLLDVQLRNGVGSGIELVGPLSSTGASVVMLTAERRRTVLAECLEAGAAGWIGTSTDLEEVDTTLRRVVAGGAIVGRTERAELLERLRLERANAPRCEAGFDKLTQREALVLASLTDGLTAEEIARAHFVALTTVRSQIRSVLQKLGVRSQLAAVAVASTHRELLPGQALAGRDRRRAPRRANVGADYSAHIA